MKFVLIALLLAGCGTSATTEDTTMTVENETLPAQILRENPDWKTAYDAVELNEAAVQGLKGVEPAQVEVYLGLWCGDSRREVVRHFRLTEAANMPFTTKYISLGRDFATVAELEAVPTFVVSRNGKELGRIIETSPTTLEQDLASLLSGRTSGRISASR